MSKRIIQLTRQSAADGMVLLKNDGQVLPLQSNEPISVFGRCQIDYYRSGTGSGGAVNVPYSVNVIQGLNNLNCHINTDLLSIYDKWIKENPFDNGGGGWAAEPWFQKEMPLTDEVVKQARAISDKAVVIIGRTAGEDQDNAEVEGSYLLTEEEKRMLNKVTTHFESVVVVLNVSNIIDMSWVYDASHVHPIKSVLYAWHGGMEGGNALADILTGQVVPSGKLTDTIAYQLKDYPSYNHFGDLVRNYYEEDIYIGYKYFETFKPSAVQFGFGYGLSYTTFDITHQSSEVISLHDDLVLNVEVAVKNTGKTYSGKEVVQLYYSAPQGELGKPYKVLGAFHKTKLLSPGEEESITLTLPFKEMASFDDGGYTGHQHAYVLEAGDYEFYLGNSVRQSSLIKVNDKTAFSLDELIVVEQLEEVMAPVQSFNRLKPGKYLGDGLYEHHYEPVPLQEKSIAPRILENMPETFEAIDDKKYVLKDVAEGLVSMEGFIAQLSVEELATMVKGEGMCSPKVTAGTAAAFGGISDALQAYGIPVAAAADGPSGIRMDSGQQATQVAIGTLQACSWDPQIIEALYEEVGKELLENRIDTLLGPGLNIHRHPLNGRNFEYFSEDPLMTGVFATAVTKGLHQGGSSATLKHFIANDQEEERHTVDAIMSQRALRESNLKGFEMAVKQGQAVSIMTSYNPINGIYAASNYDLNTTVLRKEWGFNGIVMTDWWAKVNHPVDGGVGKTFKKSYMVRAQNDLYMVVGHDQAQDFDGDNLLTAVASGELSKGELQRSAINICRFLMNAQCFTNVKGDDHAKLYPSHAISRSEDVFSSGDVIKLFENPTKTFSLHVLEDGVYQVKAKMRYDANSLAQAAYNLMINDGYAVTVPLNGTNNEWKESAILQVELQTGYYEIALDFVRPGIEVGQLLFTQIKK